MQSNNFRLRVSPANLLLYTIDCELRQQSIVIDYSGPVCRFGSGPTGGIRVFLYAGYRKKLLKFNRNEGRYEFINKF